MKYYNIASFVLFAQILFLCETVGSEIDDICSDQRCVKKCCAEDHVLQSYNCTPSDTVPDFSDVLVYAKNISVTTKSVKDVFKIIPNYYGLNETFRNISLDFLQYYVNFKFYLTEDSMLHRETPNAFKRWFVYRETEYCLDYKMDANDTIIGYVFMTAIIDEYTPTSGVFVKTALLVSIFFLFLVLVVYSLLPDLRNLNGKVLMSYVSSQMGAFLFLVVLQLGDYPIEGCYGLTFSTYFCFMASFCWMNVMSYDIWWTFRGYAKARPIHRRGERFKFMMYSLYAWGVSTGMTIMLAVLNSIDLTHIPWFVQPQVPDMGCFIEGGQKLVYMYIPMLIMIIFNWMFYLMTAYNVWRLNRGTAVLDSAAAGTPASHRSQRQRFMIYLKLSVVTGVSWLLELVSVLMPTVKLFIISDIYNTLMGFIIFLIFVCKKQIYRKLKKRFNESKWSRTVKASQSSSSMDTQITQETPLQVCVNPKGSSF